MTFFYPIAAIILLAMYSLRDSRGPSVWYLSGIALRLYANEIYIHARKLPAHTLNL